MGNENWRPGNWDKIKPTSPYLDWGGESFNEGAEAGADAMHKADVDFIRIFYPETYFRIQASMPKEQFEAWAR